MEGKTYQVYLSGELRERFEEEQEARGTRGKPMPANALLKVAVENLLAEEKPQPVRRRQQAPMTREEKEAARRKYDREKALGLRE